MNATPQRLRDATAGLLTQRPAAQVSLREITNAAGANVASVGYHFGSKDELVAQVLKAAIEATTTGQRVALLALAHDASLEQIVRTWLAPALAPAAANGLDRSWLLIGRQLGDPTPSVRAVFDGAFDDVDAVLVQRLRPHLPHLGDEELRLRHRAVLATLGGLGMLTAGRTSADTPPHLLADQLVPFLIGGLAAPSARRAPQGGG